MTRVGFSGKGGVTKHSELTDVSTPHVLADLVSAVCSETEAAAIAAAAVTKEFYVPATSPVDGAAMSEHGDFPVIACNALNECALISFDIPHDFNSLITAVLTTLAPGTQAGSNWDISSDYCADGEAFATHSESDTATTYDAVITERLDIDISGILSAIAAGDAVGIRLKSATEGHDVNIVGVRIRYT